MRRVRVAALFTLFLTATAIWLSFIISKQISPYGGWGLSTDTAIATEAHFIRHKSMTDLYEVFGMGPGLLPYFPSDFVWAPPPYLNAHEELR